MTDTTTQFKTQLPWNLSVQVLSFVVQVAIGIWLVPYLIHHLGRAAYGLIPIAAIMTQYVSLISYSVSSAVNRFLTIALQRGDVEDANRIFNTAFFSYLAIGLLQIPIFGLIIYYAGSIFTIPEELYRDATILLSCSAASFLVNLVASVFGVPIYANNRVDISRAIDIGRQVFRMVGVVTLFLMFRPALRYVGYVDLAISLVSCLATAAVGKRLPPVLRVCLRSYDWRKIGDLLGMGGWLLVNYLGSLFFLRIDIWVCNRFVGAAEAGDYAAVLQWANLIRQAGGILAGVTAPMIMIYYARCEMDRLIRLSKTSVRLFSLGLAIPISTICVFSPSLLRLWLGESFVHLWPLMIIMVCHLIVNVGVTPLFNIKTALNKVKWPGVATLIGGIANLLLALSFVKYSSWGIYGVAIAGALVLTLKNAFFMPIYGALILGQSWHAFLKPYLSGVVFLIGLAALQLVVSYYYRPASWVHLAVIAVIVGSLALVVAWFCLPREDRRVLDALVPARIRNMLVKPAVS